MPFYIAIPVGDTFNILPEQFEVRSNALRYAERKGYRNANIITEKQKRIIEEGGNVEEKAQPTGKDSGLATSGKSARLKSKN